jgi:SAM-dependent methyltransferase
MANVDKATVEGFGDEWRRFTQSALSEDELNVGFDEYFAAFPWSELPPGARGADFGCGSGRWARVAARRVGHLLLVDASADALAVAKKELTKVPNVEFFHGSVESVPAPDASLDFAYSLGVLHHVPDTQGALAAIARKLKPGAPFLVYLYYAFDNRPVWYRGLWRASDVLRRVISRLPHGARYGVSQAIAVGVYFPLARSGALLERFGLMPRSWPLQYYRDRSFYTMRTDALDRFGTRLEKRFTRREIATMLHQAGFEDVRFSESMPFWTACARKR